MKIKGQFIKSLREAKGLTRTQVSRMVGYSSAAIWSIEKKGNSRSEIELLARLSILFNISIESMLDMDEIVIDLVRIKKINAKIPTIS